MANTAAVQQQQEAASDAAAALQARQQATKCEFGCYQGEGCFHIGLGASTIMARLGLHCKSFESWLA